MQQDERYINEGLATTATHERLSAPRLACGLNECVQSTSYDRLLQRPRHGTRADFPSNAEMWNASTYSFLRGIGPDSPGFDSLYRRFPMGPDIPGTLEYRGPGYIREPGTPWSRVYTRDPSIYPNSGCLRDPPRAAPCKVNSLEDHRVSHLRHPTFPSPMPNKADWHLFLLRYGVQPWTFRHESHSGRNRR